MRLARYFIDRPRFAVILSALVVLAGALAYPLLPISQYPEIAPPTIKVTASYPGADPLTIAETVAAPIEQAINGLEGMLYLESSSTSDGLMALTVTFDLGTDIDEAQVLVQNRVATVEPRLPESVRSIGVTTEKQSPGILLIVHLTSPDGSRDNLYLANYAFLQIRDQLARLEGIGGVDLFGGSEYSMRIWLDIERLASFDLTPGDVAGALRDQNTQIAAGALGKPPVSQPIAFEVPVSSRGRLKDAREFGEIIIKRGANGSLVRLRDVARIELGAQEYTMKSRLDGRDAVAIVLRQRPGSNALATADRVIETVERLAKRFPDGVQHRIVYNPTKFVASSIDEVYKTLLITAILVALTVFVFLQGWRSTLIPVIAIPISLVGTFAVMYSVGVSLNSLSLFGLVLAIGIVVDDAIVVVENVDRLLSEGLTPKQAARKAMDEVGSALIATTLVLLAVFVPSAFISGITGEFFRQFALTISAATAISTFVSLTLSPTMAAVLLRAKGENEGRFGALVGKLFWPFNKLLDMASVAYTRVVARALRWQVAALIVFALLLGGTYKLFQVVPTGFIPAQDQGYLIVAVQLPQGSSIERTDETTRRVAKIAAETPGIAHVNVFSGFSGATFSSDSSAATIFTPYEDFEVRAAKGLTSDVIINDLRRRTAGISDAYLFVISPPSVPGIGIGGGFKMQVQDRSGEGVQALNNAAWKLVSAANQEPGLTSAYSSFSTTAPQIFANIDTTRARMLNVPIGSINEGLQAYLGSLFVNEFTYLGRPARVTIQAAPQFRNEESDILRLRARSDSGAVVPLGSLVTLEKRATPARVVRYNLYPAADVSGAKLPTISTGQALAAMERLAEEHLPPTMSYEWTDLAYQERTQGNTAMFVFALSVLLAFMVLAAQYESWLLPLSIVLIVPLCLLFGLGGVVLRGMDNNVLVQIAFVLLVALACKNAILIVEFARTRENEGLSPTDAVIEACRLRLRPILMTAVSFILGVLPLAFAAGAGAEMRQAIGTTVLFGMLGVTLFGLLMTPVFYKVLRRSTARPEDSV
ncbi:MAG: multidrug efflux RND transporter permease subunit [Planctomycetota bacterium]